MKRHTHDYKFYSSFLPLRRFKQTLYRVYNNVNIDQSLNADTFMPLSSIFARSSRITGLDWIISG